MIITKMGDGFLAYPLFKCNQFNPISIYGGGKDG